MGAIFSLYKNNHFIRHNTVTCYQPDRGHWASNFNHVEKYAQESTGGKKVFSATFIILATIEWPSLLVF